MPPSAIAEAAEAAEKAREWLRRRDAAICRARADGRSLRQIEDATGLSHAAIAKIGARVTTSTQH